MERSVHLLDRTRRWMPHSRTGRVLSCAALAVTILLGAGCAEGQGVDETSSPPATPANQNPDTTRDEPTCTSIDVSSTLFGKPHEVDVLVEADNLTRPGIYDFESVQFDYGDSPADFEQVTDVRARHQYHSAGTYTVGATIILDVAPRAETPPMLKGNQVHCPSTTVTVQ